MGANPTWQEVIQAAMDARALDINTACPGVVETYANRHADIKLAVRRPVDTASGGLVCEDLPIIPNVPIVFPGGGGFALTWPLNPGDPVLVVFCTFSPQQFRATGEVPSDPGDLRLHSLASAYAIPGIPPGGPPLPDPAAALPAMVMDGPDIRLGALAMDPVANGAAVKAWIDALSTAVAPSGGGAITVTPPTDPLYANTSSILAPKVKVERAP